MGRATHRKTNQKRFEEAVKDGVAPEVFILEVAQGKRAIKTRKDERAYDAAKTLLPYRLPKLNNIDAINRNVDLPHEEFIKTLIQEEEK